jgi:hypothetical protein
MADPREDTDTVLARQLEQLPKDIEPTADLWPGIAAAIPDEPMSQHSVDAAFFDKVPAEIEPAIDLWPGIETRLRRDGRLPLFNRPVGSQYWLLAACLAVVAITAALLVRGPEGVYGPATGPDVTSNQTADQGVSGSIDSFASDLLLPVPRDVYSGELQETLREQIAAVRNERMQIEASLGRYPGDPALRKLWQSTYAQELKLIDTAGRVLSTI